MRGITGGTAPLLKYNADQINGTWFGPTKNEYGVSSFHYYIYNLHFSKSKKRKKTTILPKKPGNDYRDRPYVNKEHRHARAKRITCTHFKYVHRFEHLLPTFLPSLSPHMSKYLIVLNSIYVCNHSCIDELPKGQVGKKVPRLDSEAC